MLLTDQVCLFIYAWIQVVQGKVFCPQLCPTRIQELKNETYSIRRKIPPASKLNALAAAPRYRF